MCGILGLVARSALNPQVEAVRAAVLADLYRLSMSRGREAAGVMAYVGEEIQVLKQPIAADKFMQTKEYGQLVKTGLNRPMGVAIFGHARMATNGAWDTNANNQPVIFNHLVGIHNGIVTNEKEIWAKLGKPPATQVDTEALMALMDANYEASMSLAGAVGTAIAEIEGAASVVVMSALESKIVMATNTGSLYSGAFTDGWVVGSERNIVERAGRALGVQQVMQLRAGEGLVFNLETFSSKVFRLGQVRRIGIRKRTEKLPIREISSGGTLGKILRTGNSLSVLQQHGIDEVRIARMRRCSRCILPETTPFITFDGAGVCSFCREHQKISYTGIDALRKLVEPFRNLNGEPDCLVGFSGGRDSSYGLYLVKKVLGLNPIAYTYDWGMLSDLGRQNAARVTGTLGVEHVIVSADIAQKRENIRKNILAWLKKPDLGMVPLFMAGDKASEYYMNELSRKTGIKLIIYCRGNSFEREEFKAGHAGVKDADPGGVIHRLPFFHKLKMAGYYSKRFLENPAYLNSSLLDTMMAYRYTYFIRHEYVYLWHYLPWNEAEVLKTIRKEFDWQSPADNPATWRVDDGSPAFYNYIYYQVQGFTEHDSFRSHQIREGIISRSRALELVQRENQPRYEALKWYFDALSLDGDEVLRVVDTMPKLY